MPITDAARILLVADASRTGGENTKAKIRRYRLARPQVDASHRSAARSAVPCPQIPHDVPLREVLPMYAAKALQSEIKGPLSDGSSD